MPLEDLLRATLQDPSRRPSPLLADRIMSALPARRAAWHQVRPSWSGPLAAAAVLAVVFVVGPSLVAPNSVAPVATGPDPAATATATAIPSPTVAPSASAPTIVGTYADGMPRQIDGEPVLRGDAIGRKVAQRTDDSPFLIGGYLTLVLADCAIVPDAPLSPLVALCGDGYHLSDTGIGPGSRLVVDRAASDVLRGGGLQVMRVHVVDARAAACAPAIRRACEQALVVEASVWSGPADAPLRIPNVVVDADGIPVEIDGEPVLRGDDITVRIAVASDSQRFLIGGWATDRFSRCAAATTSPDVTPPPRDPAQPRSSAQPHPGSAIVGCMPPAIMLMDAPVGEDGIIVRVGSWSNTGAVVLRVHVLGLRACPNDVTICEKTVVLDEVVWSQP